MHTSKFAPKGWARQFSIALAVLLLLGIAGEILLRVYPRSAQAARGHGDSAIMQQIRMQSGLNKMVYAPDSELGALLAPSRRDALATLDFSYVLQTDHAGFPNPEPWPSRVDVAVLGNSLLVGAGVGIDGQFTTLLENRLGGRTVLNFGLPGGGTEHEHRVYRSYVEPLQPKLVIAMLWLTWDIDNTLQFEHWRTEKSDTNFTQYRMTYGDTHRSGTQAEPTGLWQFAKRQIRKSHLIRAAYGGVQSLLETDRILERVTFPNGDTIFLSAREEIRLARGTDRLDTPNLREIFFRPLERLRTEVEEDGDRFVIVLVPSKEEIYGAEAFPAVLRTMQEVKSELESRQLPVLDLYPVFRELGRERPPFYRADMHLNEFGNRIVAEAIEQWIVDEKIFTGPSAAADPGGRGANNGRGAD